MIEKECLCTLLEDPNRGEMKPLLGNIFYGSHWQPTSSHSFKDESQRPQFALSVDIWRVVKMLRISWPRMIVCTAEIVMLTKLLEQWVV
ncbi:unnamed protein product [Urochloa humidicola]